MCYLNIDYTLQTNNSHALVVQGSFALSADTTIEKKPHNVVALKDGNSCMVSAKKNSVCTSALACCHTSAGITMF
jgi:hypothetical protein